MPSPQDEAHAFPKVDRWFQALAEHAPVLIWASGPDGLCTYFNQRWLQFTGRTLEESLGDGWVEDVHPDDRNRVRDEYTHAFQARQEFRLEYRLKHYSCGRYQWIVDFGAPVFCSEGSFLGYIGSCIDQAATQGGGRETNWRQKYESLLADGNSKDLPERIAAAEVAIRERLEQSSASDEQASLQEALEKLLVLKQDTLGFVRE